MVHPKIAMAPNDWWLPEEKGVSPHNNGIWDINVNLLIPMGCLGEAGFGGAPLKTMLCKIYSTDASTQEVQNA